jgi:sec-independent protein translocase protein TatC
MIPTMSEDDHEMDDDYVDGLDDGYFDDEGSAERGMTFLEHLEDFRWTVAKSLLAFIIGVGLVAVFIGQIADFLQMPLLRAYGSAELMQENLKTYRPMGVISVFIQIALLGGLTLSMPFGLYFLGCFVAPGLTEKERRVLRPACFAAFLLFLAGVAFAFFLILPVTLGFFVRLNLFFEFELLWAASEYYSMIVWFSLATGAFFQFPLIVVILVYLGVLTVEKLRDIRRGVFVGLMIFAALLTPGGDFVSLPLTTGFMYALYEMAIWVGARIEKRKAREAEEDELGD